MTASGFLRRHNLSEAHRLFPNAHGSDAVSRWNHPHSATAGKALVVRVRDAGGEYTLPYRCVRYGNAWRRVGYGRPLTVEVVGWRYSDRGIDER